MSVAKLPPSYHEALSKLDENDASNPPIASLTDEKVLALSKEILSNFYCTKNQWSSGDWSTKEAELLKLAGSAAEFSKAGGRQILGSAVGDYLRTFVDALEYKLGEKKTQPELLSKKRQVDDAEVYGPIAMSPLYPGNTFELWTSPLGANGVQDEIDNIGQVAVVLGAGNQSFLTLIDILDNVLRSRRPVLAKHHPLRPWLSTPFGIILEPLARRGYFAQVEDVSVEATKALLANPAVGHVHVTGALKTAQAIHATLQKAHPKLSSDQIKSMITSELGCATPQILDDGVYTELEIKHAAQSIAFGKKANGGCNCLSSQVVVLPKRWAQKDAFRAKLYEELKRQPTTPCYYPGSVERKAGIIEKCEQAGSKCTTVVADSVSEEIKVSEADQVVVVECGTPGEKWYDNTPLLAEAFGPVLAIVEMDNGDAGDDYLANTVVPFLNSKDNIFGSLSCSIYTPLSKGKSYDREGLQAAIATLQYGGISVNQLNLFGYLAALKGGVWGGVDALGQSGNGHIGDHYEITGNRNAKVVVYGPSLETKPMFDLANNPPTIVLDVLLEVACSPSVFTAVVRVMKLLATRSVCGVMYYVPVVGRLFQ